VTEAAGQRLILASGSPRRRELLAALIDEFEVVPSGIEEPLDGDPVANAVNLAAGKARDVASRNPDALVIGADTIVFMDGKSYGKPIDADDVLSMWRELRGRAHGVATGLAVVGAGCQLRDVSVSNVVLTDLEDAGVRAYAASGRPLDKAGAYAIQDEDVPTVARLDGCYCSVMGLPLWRLRTMLVAAGVACRESPARPVCETCPERPAAP
jgi:septum formation protein